METFTLQIHITGFCNCRCKHCYLDENPDEMSVAQLKIVLEQYREFISFWQNQHGRRLRPYVNITGGEPLMHKQIFDVLDLMDAYRDVFEFRLLSNGTVLNERLLARLQQLNLLCVQVSLDGDEALHDGLRGEGNFKAVVRGLDRLYAYGIPSKVSFTAHADNYRSFGEVARICREHHVDSLWSDRYIPCGGHSELRSLTPMQTKEYVELLQAERVNPHNRQNKLRILNRRSLQFLKSGEYPYHCTAGQNAIAVDDKGDVYPCRRMTIKCGNVFRDSLQEIYMNAPAFLILRNAGIPEQCASCQHVSFCRGGSKCLSYALFGCTNEKDPGCWL